MDVCDAQLSIFLERNTVKKTRAKIGQPGAIVINCDFFYTGSKAIPPPYVTQLLYKVSYKVMLRLELISLDPFLSNARNNSLTALVIF